MRKLFTYTGSVVLLFVLISTLMFAFSVCPPRGPWPNPPWCHDAFVRQPYEVSVSTVPLTQVKAVNMFDTWGRNYNMGMFETTQANVAPSFLRVKELGAKEVYVHDFHRAVYEGEESFANPEYDITDETFWNDFRDESISPSELIILADEAHRQGLKLGIKHNLSLVNIGKYMLNGLDGTIQENVMKDADALNASVNEVWIQNFFAKWNERIIARARLYNDAGVDIMSVTPSFVSVNFAGHEVLVNELYKKLIADVRKEFKGQIYTEINIYGLMDGKLGKEDWEKYDFYKDADIQETRVYALPERFRTKDVHTVVELQQALSTFVQALNRRGEEKGIRISLFFAPSSYVNSINRGPVEIYDVNNAEVRSLVKDWDEQAASFDAVFKALVKAPHIARINVGNFAWDDALDPAVTPRISITAMFRNKPAEEVIKQWMGR